MARYTGPVCRFCRREGVKLYLKGERCYTEKCSFDRKSFVPGMHGKRRSKISEYGTQLREKQKVEPNRAHFLRNNKVMSFELSSDRSDRK